MPTPRAKFKNTTGHVKLISAGVATALRAGGEVDKLVQKHLYGQLYDSKNEDGTPRPQSSPKGQKKPETIKAYERAKQGWNTKNYLVRTGAATTLRSKNSRKGTRLTIKPEGMKILSYHIPESKHRGKIRWMRLAPDKPRLIVDIMRKEVAKELK
jgi:hypothetical protein